MSVERELAGAHEPATTSGDNTKTPSETTQAASEEVLDRLSDLQSTLDDVYDSVGRIKSRTSTEGPMYDLEKVVLELLDTPPEMDPSDAPHRANSDYHGAEWAQTASEIANRIGADESDVASVLGTLSERQPFVHGISGGPDGEGYFWRDK
jgi:hypothetical protein